MNGNLTIFSFVFNAFKIATSPSPLTITSKTLDIFSSLDAVACGPPKIILTDGFSSFKILAISSAVLICGVVAYI